MGRTREIAGVDVDLDHWIGGRRVSSSDTFEDVSPIDEAVLGAVARGGPEEAVASSLLPCLG